MTPADLGSRGTIGGPETESRFTRRGIEIVKGLDLGGLVGGGGGGNAAFRGGG